MKKLLAVLIFLAPVVAFAHGGVSKNAGSTIVYLSQNPLSPLVGENVDFAFTITDKNSEPMSNLPTELTVIDTFFGDETKDKVVVTKNTATDSNGIIEFSYSFPNPDYYDLELAFKDPNGGTDQTGFLVQPRTGEMSARRSIALPLSTGLVIGVFIGIMIKSKFRIRPMKTLVMLVLAAALIVGLFIYIKPHSGSDETQVSNQPATKNFELVVKNKQLVSGTALLEVNQNDVVTITITNDADEELHLHGYDKAIDLTANQPATLTFTANLSGRFIYELEHSGTEIGALEVQPK